MDHDAADADREIDEAGMEMLGALEGVVDALWLFFPDPWHKKRHHKRRLLNGLFVALLASRLKPGGLLRAATDWEPYAVAMLEVFGSCPLLQNTAAEGG